MDSEEKKRDAMLLVEQKLAEVRRLIKEIEQVADENKLDGIVLGELTYHHSSEYMPGGWASSSWCGYDNALW